MFTPTVTGTRTATLGIQDNGGSTPQSIPCLVASQRLHLGEENPEEKDGGLTHVRT